MVICICLQDTPGANYRAVWAMTKHFPHVKTFVRAHDLVHALNLEKAGATVSACQARVIFWQEG